MKTVHAGTFLWPIYDGIGDVQTTQLPDHIKTEVIVVGGGISGLITAYQMWKTNVPVVIVEANKLAYGSTLASTGILQYSSDIRLPDLRARIGTDKADCFYKASAQAIFDLRDIAQLIKEEIADPHFILRNSLQYASTKEENINITQQYNAYQSIGFSSQLVGETTLQTTYPNLTTEAIRTNGDAEINPFLFVKYLAAYLLKQGVPIYEYAYFKPAASNRHTQNDSMQGCGIINDKIPVCARHIVYTVGYQHEQLEQPLILPILNRSYVLATEPVKHLDDYYNGEFIWETANPYIYVRKTIDQRIIIGGLDEVIATPNENINEVNEKNKRLITILKQLFPKLNFKQAYNWNATFAESKDSLPFIGPSPTQPFVSYLCGYGGNGTVYSMIGAKLLTLYVTNQKEYEAQLLATVVNLTR